MKLSRIVLIYTLPLSLLIWFCAIYNAHGQDSKVDTMIVGNDSPHIEWVKSWPAPGIKHQSKTFRDQLNSLLFGIQQPELRTPVSILASNPDEFWVVDQGNMTLYQVRKGLGDIPHSVLKTGYDLSSLVGICEGPNSSILFTDSHAGKIYMLIPGQKKLQMLNDSLLLEQPTGIAYSRNNNEIYVLETRAHRITILNEKGEVKRRIGTRGTAPGEFNYPTHLWLDKKGYLYITDAMNFRIQVLDNEAKVLSVFGEAGDATGYLARPKGIATDSFGNIYVVDALFHVVQVFDIKGNLLYKFGAQGRGNSEFWMPSGIFIDANDTIYVADSYNSRVQVFNLIHKDKK